MVQKRLGMLLQQELSMYGLTEEQYFKQRNITKDTFDRTYYQIALRDLKIQLILDHIAVGENVTVSDEERAEYIKSEAERLGYTVDQIDKMAAVEQLNAQVKMRKAYDYLLKNANYVEPKTETK
jgi:FKBP-type peptidyl-prolyl cis-trans isomerase (trigger factor)